MFDFFLGIFYFVRDYLVDVFFELAHAPSPFYVAVIVFLNGLWIPVVIIMYRAFLTIWQDSRQGKYHDANRKFILLAIDVPRDNEQSPRAVEFIFSHLHGILPGRNNKYEEWIEGRTVDYFSMEIISIEGYVQFLVYTQEEYRDTVESAFYAQYPDAEITQVEDYVYGQGDEFRNLKFPSSEYNLFGTEFILAKGNAYPIRLHPEFEHSLSQEFKDPMASLLENMNKIGPGEQMWIQLVITPEYDSNWVPAVEKAAMKIAGKATDVPQNAVDKSASGLVKLFDFIGQAVFPFYGPNPEETKKDELPSLMLHLTPAEQNKIQGIQLKADKQGFWTKFRFVYIGKKEVFSKPRGVSTILGSMKQFNSLNLNSIVMHKYTKTAGLDYVFTKRRMARRQNNILRAFQDRARSAGSGGIILNIEELATLYHFPTITVKAPLVSRTQAKRGSAPVGLPIDSAPRTLRSKISGGSEQASLPQPSGDAKQPERSAELPTNLPFI